MNDAGKHFTADQTEGIRYLAIVIYCELSVHIVSGMNHIGIHCFSFLSMPLKHNRCILCVIPHLKNNSFAETNAWKVCFCQFQFTKGLLLFLF